MRRFGMQIVLAAVLMACGAARAEDWPARPITLVVPYAAGGPTDAVGRLFAQQMSEFLGRQIVVENIARRGRHDRREPRRARGARWLSGPFRRQRH